MRKYIIAVDFDGTIVAAKYPDIGRDLGGLFWLSQLKNAGGELILWTCRTGRQLAEARDWMEDNGYLDLFSGFNEQAPSVQIVDDPRKIIADVYVGDRALGAPIRHYVDGRLPDHYDWNKAGPVLIKMITAAQKRWKEAKS